jgi:hypothetical protein
VTSAREPLSPRDLAELALTAADFPEFRLWRETILGRTCYVARSRDLDSHPHTVVADDLDKLSAVLRARRQVSGDSDQQ